MVSIIHEHFSRGLYTCRLHIPPPTAHCKSRPPRGFGSRYKCSAAVFYRFARNLEGQDESQGSDSHTLTANIITASKPTRPEKTESSALCLLCVLHLTAEGHHGSYVFDAECMVMQTAPGEAGTGAFGGGTIKGMLWYDSMHPFVCKGLMLRLRLRLRLRLKVLTGALFLFWERWQGA